MIENFSARLLLRIRYRRRTLATNGRQFEAAAAAIEKLIAATPEPVLRGRRPVPALPGVGRFDSRGAYAVVAFHLQLHVPQIRHSIELNGQG